MIVSHVQRGLLATVCALAMTLSSCAGTPDSKFYLLEPLTGSPAPEGTVTIDQGISIGVGPVTLPEYLDRPQIVTRTNRNTVLLAEFDRWAEPLSSNVSRTMAENLIYLLHDDSVLPYPWPGSVDVAYQVLVDVYRFDGVLGEKAWLDAQWSVQSRKDKNVLMLKRATFVEPAGDPSYEALVAAQSRALGNLSREIAAALKGLMRDRVRE
jgi:uncharacterized protein